MTQRAPRRDENDQRKEPTVTEKVALAEAVAERLGARQGQRTNLATSGNISLSESAGQTRDIAAAKTGLGSGKTLEAFNATLPVQMPSVITFRLIVGMCPVAQVPVWGLRGTKSEPRSSRSHRAREDGPPWRRP